MFLLSVGKVYFQIEFTIFNLEPVLLVMYKQNTVIYQCSRNG